MVMYCVGTPYLYNVHAIIFMMKYYKRYAGFTIVELLIVIVVIAILAAISVVAYNGIQQRAQVSAAASFANGSLKTLAAYKAAEGSYPLNTTGCIGSGYEDKTSDSVPDCRWNGGTNLASENYSMQTELAKYVSQQFAAPKWTSQNGSNQIRGGYYTYISNATLDGAPHYSWYVYTVPGRECPVGPIARVGSPNWYNLVTDTSVNYSEAWSSGSLCWVPLK